MRDRTARRRLTLGCSLVAALLLGGACAGLHPAPAGWSREVYREGRSHCRSGECRVMLTSGSGSLLVSTSAREYSPHEIPGWDGGSKAGRVASSVLQWIIRSRGGATDRVTIGVGTRVVTDTSRGRWRLSCTAFWIDDEEIEKNDDGDHVAAVSASPPMSLERLTADGRVDARYDVRKQAPASVAKPTLAERVGLVTRLRVTREDGTLMAMLYAVSPRAAW